VAPEPGAGTTFEGEKCAVKPTGSPAAVKVMAALKVEFGRVVSVRVLEVPGATLGDAVEGAIENVGAAATLTEIDFRCVTQPPVAETVAV
jgi:hypothetical protein